MVQRLSEISMKVRNYWRDEQMRYYSTQRPITPGSYPAPAFNQVTAIHNYDSRTYCEEIGREARGYIEYGHPLHPEVAIDFELTPPPSKIKKIRFIGMDSWRCMIFEDESGKLWKYTEPGERPMERHDRLYSSTNNALDGEPCWPMMPDIDYQIEADNQDTK